MSGPKSILPSDYPGFLAEVKSRISRERVRAALSANSAMILLYWDIGKLILSRQVEQGWGSQVIEQLARDLKVAFPKMTGFSVRSLRNMRMFARSWPDGAIVLRFIAQLPWSTNLALLNKLRDPELRLWYARHALENGLTRDMLVFHIESQLHLRQGLSQHNFPSTMPPGDSELAAEVFKDPYLFDFLGTTEPRREAELERGLIDHIQHFLLELGQGFAFVGRQVELKVGDREFRIDLLFYHLELRCFVVVELKTGRFEPEYVGKLNMYLNAVDKQKAHSSDNPSIGLLLVKEKDQLVVEYALGGTRKPMGVAQWERRITKSLPEEWKSSLPTVEEIEAELG